MYSPFLIERRASPSWCCSSIKYCKLPYHDLTFLVCECKDYVTNIRHSIRLGVPRRRVCASRNHHLYVISLSTVAHLNRNLSQEDDITRGDYLFVPYLPNVRGDSLGRGSSKFLTNISQSRGGLYNPTREWWPPGTRTNSDQGVIRPCV